MASMQEINEIFERLDDIKRYLATDRTFFRDLSGNQRLVNDLKVVVSELEDVYFANVADGTTRSHVIEDD